MCQQGSSEVHSHRVAEMSKIYDKYDRHVSGEEPLTDEELKDLAVKLFVLKY